MAFVCKMANNCKSIYVFNLLGCLLLLQSVDGKREKRSKDIHTMGDEAYDMILILVQGKFNVPLKKQSRVQWNTVVRFW